MLGKIIDINKNIVTVSLDIDITNQASLTNLHVVFEDGNKKIVGEIISVNKDNLIISVLGEVKDNIFIPGITKKPSFKSITRMIKLDELETIYGRQQIDSIGKIYLGNSTLYNNYRINVDVNKFLSNHVAILGNTGAGKSFTVAKILQNIFTGSGYVP